MMVLKSELVLFGFIAILLLPRAIKSDSSLEVIDIVISSLSRENWNKTDASCFRDTKALFDGVKNRTLWASWIWNSMQLPVGNFYGSKYHLGNFDQCLQVPWSSHKSLLTQYCLVDVKMSTVRPNDGEIDPYSAAVKYIEMESRYGSRFNALFLGVCLPITCKPASVARISRLIFQLSHLPLESLHVDPRDCQVAAKEMQPSLEFHAFWYIILFMTLTCVLVYYAGIFLKKLTESKTLVCFSLGRNFDALTETSNGEIKVMHGMRALTCGTLLVSHYIYFFSEYIINHIDHEKDFTKHYMAFTLHFDTFVDTFFVMSGLLHFKGLLARRSKSFNTIVKRYLRLVAPLALSLICVGHVLPHLGSGPVWPRLVRDHLQPCADNWWKNLLMMGNIYDGKVCMILIWYLHCDFQLTTASTVAFALYQRSYQGNTRKGCVIFVLAYLLSVAVPAVITYWFEIPALLLYDFGQSRDITQNKMFEKVYVKSHSRAGPYIIGMAMGYLITLYRPHQYRKVISKTWSIIGCIFSLLLIALVLFLGVRLFNKAYSPIMIALLASLDRSIWAFAICAMILVCEYGTVPIVNDFLSSKVFVPLSKLAYSMYVWQTVFMYRNLMSLRAPYSYDFYHMVINGLGFVVICYCFSYLFWLFIEAPVSNLINVLFDYRTKESLTNGKTEIKKENGVKYCKSL